MTSLKMKFIGMQFILYSFVGALTCLIDFGFFIFFKWANISLIASFMLAFSLATLANYFFCRKFIFASNDLRSSQQILRTFFVSLVGLILSTCLFATLNRYTSILPLWNKVLIIPAIMAWNFWARRTLVFSPGLPDATHNALSKLFRSRDNL